MKRNDTAIDIAPTQLPSARASGYLSQLNYALTWWYHIETDTDMLIFYHYYYYFPVCSREKLHNYHMQYQNIPEICADHSTVQNSQCSWKDALSSSSWIHQTYLSRKSALMRSALAQRVLNKVLTTGNYNNRSIWVKAPGQTTSIFVTTKHAITLLSCSPRQVTEKKVHSYFSLTQQMKITDNGLSNFLFVF